MPDVGDNYLKGKKGGLQEIIHLVRTQNFPKN